VTSGVAGAFSAPNIVIMAGLAETLGGAVSMGLAAFASARAQYEFYQSEVQRERDEIERWPDRERDEIRGIYLSKGFSGKMLNDIVSHITSDRERWANVMMRSLAACGVHGFVLEPTTDMKYIADKFGRTHVFVGNADCRILLSGTKAAIRASTMTTNKMIIHRGNTSIASDFFPFTLTKDCYLFELTAFSIRSSSSIWHKSQDRHTTP
jgi:hypothetical protein